MTDEHLNTAYSCASL